MFNVYPYSPAHAALAQIANEEARNSLDCINRHPPQKDSATMHPALHSLEEHVRVINANRLQEALRAEQLRLAKGRQTGSISRTITNMRIATATALISAGQRLASRQSTEVGTA